METRNLLAILVLSAVTVHGFRNGESISTASERLYCGRAPLQRLPFHVSDRCSGSCQPRDDSPPYHIKVAGNGNTYWDDDVEITIESIERISRWRVNGFAAFALDENEQIVGTWAQDNIVQFSCGSSREGMTAVHEQGDPTRRRVIIRWTPLSRNHGHITFRAIVVHSQDIYWSIASNVTLYPAKTGVETIDISNRFTALVNSSVVGANIELENLPSMDAFEASFMNRLHSGWDSDNIFGAFNRDISFDDLFLNETREAVFDSPRTERRNRRPNRGNTNSFRDRILSGAFPRMPQQGFGNMGMQSMFGQTQNSFNRGLFGIGMGNQQRMFGQQSQGGSQGNMFSSGMFSPGMGSQQQQGGGSFPSRMTPSGMGGQQQGGMFRPGMFPQGMGGQQQQGQMGPQGGRFPSGMVPQGVGSQQQQRGMFPSGMFPQGMGGQQQQGQMGPQGGRFPSGMVPQGVGSQQQQRGMFPSGMFPQGMGGQQQQAGSRGGMFSPGFMGMGSRPGFGALSGFGARPGLGGVSQGSGTPPAFNTPPGLGAPPGVGAPRGLGAPPRFNPPGAGGRNSPGIGGAQPNRPSSLFRAFGMQ